MGWGEDGKATGQCPLVETRNPLALKLLLFLRGIFSVTVQPTEPGSEENAGSLTNVPGKFVISQVGIRDRGMKTQCVACFPIIKFISWLQFLFSANEAFNPGP